MKRAGLFIGVDKYTNGIQPLHCAGSDAKALGFCFARKQFDRVESLLNEEASGSAIVEKVGEMTRQLAPGDLFVLYFAGHGREFAGSHYLVGANGYLDARIAQGQVAVSELLAASEAPGVHRLFILDCCRTALEGGRSTAYVCPGSRNISLGSSLQGGCAAGILPPFILNSCSSGQQAYELQAEKRGVFTKALQQVLEDAAHPVRDFFALIDRVDAEIEKLVPSGMTQTLDQSCNPRKWGNVPLFADWESPDSAAVAAPPPVADVKPKKTAHPKPVRTWDPPEATAPAKDPNDAGAIELLAMLLTVKKYAAPQEAKRFHLWCCRRVHRLLLPLFRLTEPGTSLDGVIAICHIFLIPLLFGLKAADFSSSDHVDRARIIYLGFIIPLLAVQGFKIWAQMYRLPRAGIGEEPKSGDGGKIYASVCKDLGKKDPESDVVLSDYFSFDRCLRLCGWLLDLAVVLGGILGLLNVFRQP